MDEKSKNKTKDKIKKIWTDKGLIILLVCVIIILVEFVGLIIKNTNGRVQNKTVELKIKDIGELATQAAYCKSVGTLENDRKFFGIDDWTIPFTTSKTIYTINSVIKAGYNFEEIEINIDDVGKEINVTLPEVQILSNEQDMESLKVYDEHKSAFSKISLELTSEGLQKVKEDTVTDAIANGLFENAQLNAEILVTNMLNGQYDLTEYQVNFVYSKNVKESEYNERKEKDT